MSKKTTTQKEQELLKKIEKAKNDLIKLQQKQKIEIGALAYKHGLNQLEISALDHAFAKLAKELPLEESKIKEINSQ